MPDRIPDDVQITHPPAGESVWLRVRWKIGTDPKRPQKLAKGVNIYFTREFCKAYESLEASRQTDWETKVHELLASKNGSFNPEHNAPPSRADAGGVLVCHSGRGKAVTAVTA